MGYTNLIEWLIDWRVRMGDWGWWDVGRVDHFLFLSFFQGMERLRFRAGSRAVPSSVLKNLRQTDRDERRSGWGVTLLPDLRSLYKYNHYGYSAHNSVLFTHVKFLKDIQYKFLHTLTLVLFLGRIDPECVCVCVRVWMRACDQPQALAGQG